MNLNLMTHLTTSAQHEIETNFKVQNGYGILSFVVQKKKKSNWSLNQKLGQGPAQNWGLWENDVVEIFIQKRKTKDDISAPYLELQISPLNQTFALFVIKPRQLFYTPLDVQVQTQSEVKEDLWQGRLTFKFETQNEKVFSGVFAILNTPREYYSSNPNPEIEPDFHRPELFREIL